MGNEAGHSTLREGLGTGSSRPVGGGCREKDVPARRPFLDVSGIVPSTGRVSAVERTAVGAVGRAGGMVGNGFDRDLGFDEAFRGIGTGDGMDPAERGFRFR
ncbi:hypothetical protein GCM10010191_91110 [Actinomadura vinacea]|uniref:Uncharacterized protein n=1 Tax=Actinomadura vinacea TaxID=115336 RepID=A0ABP5XQJ2_9ACTN